MISAGCRLKLDSHSLRILHLSDLHFSQHADDTAVDSTHCPRMATRLCEAVAAIPHDLVLVSGDLSDCGDKESLLRVREYLFGDYSVSGTKRIGLKMPESRVRVIPGNHDAFNMPLRGSALDRVQKALENFASVFPNSIAGGDRCGYEWIECRGFDIYLAYADSCFIGDPEFERTKPAVPYFETTAKGNLVDIQVKRLLAWSDRGRSGRLEVGDGDSTALIPANRFTQSLKILVMHHYLCEPANCLSEWTMQFMDRQDVFQNIGLCDFDALLCGHKHIADVRSHTYGFHMKGRGKNRYLFNSFRRSLGMSSRAMPLAVRGKLINKFGRLLLPYFFGSGDENGMDDTSAISLIDLALRNPTQFRRRFKEIVASAREHRVCLDQSECEEILQHIDSNLTKADRDRLWEVVRDAGEQILRAFNQRPFIQALSGSATKRVRQSDRPRGFYLHTFLPNDTAFRIESHWYEWREDHFRLSDQPAFEIPLHRFGPSAALPKVPVT